MRDHDRGQIDERARPEHFVGAKFEHLQRRYTQSVQVRAEQHTVDRDRSRYISFTILLLPFFSRENHERRAFQSTYCRTRQ